MFGFLLSWYNIPFLVALSCCLLVALLQLVGGSSDQDVDGVSSLVQSAPPQLKELGNRLLDRVMPPTNGSHSNGDGHGSLPIDMSAMQGLLVKG